MSQDQAPDVTPSRLVGVVIARRKAISEWASEPFIVTPHAILSEPPPLEPGTSLGRVGEADLTYLGPSELTFWRGETGHYRDNLATGAPKIWVALVRDGEVWRLHLTTANPYEGESLADSPGLVLEATPMPADIASDLAAFIARHHVEETFVKRKRDKARRDPGPRGPDGRGFSGRGGA